MCKIQSETAVLKELESNVIENEVRACKGRTVKTCHRPYRAFSMQTRSKLCKILSKIEVLKVFERNLSENEVSVIDITRRIELLRHYQPFSAKNEANIM